MIIVILGNVETTCLAFHPRRNSYCDSAFYCQLLVAIKTIPAENIYGKESFANLYTRKAMIKIIIVVVAYILSIILNAFIDASLIRNGIWINHFLNSSLAVAIAVGFTMLAFGFSRKSVCLLFLFFPLRWVLFDVSLNYFRGLPLSYIGVPDKHDAFLDTLLYAFPNGQYFLKFGLLMLCIIATYMLWPKNASMPR